MPAADSIIMSCCQVSWHQTVIAPCVLFLRMPLELLTFTGLYSCLLEQVGLYLVFPVKYTG
jgi:uncharacterized membrane protein YvlD (DUF360 family)